MVLTDLIKADHVYDHKIRRVQYRLESERGNVPKADMPQLIQAFCTSLAREAGGWKDDELYVRARVCEQILPSADPDDYVALALEDENGDDRGYLHVYGWKEAVSDAL